MSARKDENKEPPLTAGTFSQSEICPNSEKEDFQILKQEKSECGTKIKWTLWSQTAAIIS